MPVFDPRDRSFPVLPVIIASNVLPLVGIYFYHLSFFALFYLYWWETMIISIFNFIKMGRAQKSAEPDPNLKINGSTLTYEQVNSKKYMRRMYGISRFFMLIFYLLFIVVFVGVVTSTRSDDEMISFVSALLFISPWMKISLAGFIITHSVDYWVWIHDEDYKTTTLRELGSPFDARMVIMHLVIVLGTFFSLYLSEQVFPGDPRAASKGYASLFVVLKTGIDMFAYSKNKRRTEVLTALKPTRSRLE